jgi:hypothetical protein
MTTLQAPPRVQQPLAIAAAQDCELSDAARKLLTPQLKAGSFLAQLARDNLWIDALRFAPYALERRSALWWATLCLWQLYRPMPAPEFDSCFQVVIAWLNEPSEVNRRAAFAAGHAAKATTPAGSLALATFFESGSISLPGRPEVPAKPQFMPQALGAAITLAIHQSPRELQAARQTDFVRLALEVMADRWPIPATATELA